MDKNKIIEKYRNVLDKTMKSSNEIIFVAGDTKPWESKLGGCPYLEKPEDYPIGKYERPMMFIAQINLDEMPVLEDFPTTGLLQFYIEDIDPFGLDEPCKVIYIETYKKDESVLLKENPFRENYVEIEPFERSGRMEFSQRKMPITSTGEEFNNLFADIPEEERDVLIDYCYASDSRVGGYPCFIQRSPAYYDDGEVNVLLLQLDIEDECGIMFGDSGNCDFLINKEKLKSRDFSEVEFDWQCC